MAKKTIAVDTIGMRDMALIIANTVGIAKADAARCIEAFFAVTLNATANRRQVVVPGFGKFIGYITPPKRINTPLKQCVSSARVVMRFKISKPARDFVKNSVGMTSIEREQFKHPILNNAKCNGNLSSVSTVAGKINDEIEKVAPLPSVGQIRTDNAQNAQNVPTTSV